MAAPYPLRRAKFGDFAADFDSFELRKHGIRLKLQDQPFQILKLLLQNPGQLVTREQLRLELWTESTFVDFDAGLNAAIRRLRDALNDSAEEPRYIETLPRHGYRFIAPVEIVAEPKPQVRVEVPSAPRGSGKDVADPAVLGPEPLASVHQDVNSKRIAWLRPVAAGCLLLLAVALGALALHPSVFARRATGGGPYSIAVLPLQNLSGDPSQDYFADGMTDALITNLAQVRSLQVISSTSSMRYKGEHPSLPEIGRELNVSLILEGSVIRSGNQVRVTAQLLDAAKDQHLWARRYDRDVKDVLRLQSEVATTVAEEIAGKLSSQDESRLKAKVRLMNPEVYEAYLKGHYFLDKWTADGFEKARGYFQESIDLDPTYVQGYVGLADYYATVAFMGTVPPRDSWLKAEGLLEKALEMDGASSEAHTLVGMIKLQFHCDRPAAEKELNRALELDPSNMGALDFHSYYLLETGRADEAIAEKKRVLEHDPLSVRTNAELGLYYLDSGRNDEAIAQLQKTLELDPNYAAGHMRLGMAYANKEQYGQAVSAFQKAISLDRKPTRVARLGELYARWGKKREALEMIRELQEMSKQRHVPPTWIALIYARLGETKAALSWLEEAKPDDEPKISDPGFDSLRTEPRFKTLEARLKPSESCPGF